MKFQTGLAASAAFFLSMAAAQAAQVAALVGDNTIAIVDTDAKKVTKTWSISGITGRVAGIDVRPADGMLYALAADGGIYTIDTASGKATMKSKLSEAVPGGTVTVDFNPAADRLRVMGSDGKNLRVNVDDGKAIVDGELKFADGDASKGQKPNVVAGAYTNSVKGTKETTLYNIEAGTAALTRQAPPNDGIQNTVGKLGVAVKGAVAFDIWSDGKGKNDAWLMASTGLHSVDLASGKVGSAIKIDGVKAPVRDIAIMPSM